jgi:hypothetical protein
LQKYHVKHPKKEQLSQEQELFCRRYKKQIFFS